MSTRILWLSRHSAQDDQLLELSFVFGEIEVIQVSKTIQKASEVLELMELHDCTEVVTVLPLDLLADLVSNSEVRPLRAVMDRVIDDDGNVTFKHSRFERVLKVDILTTPFKLEGIYK